MTAMEPEGVAAPYEPVYPMFNAGPSGLIDLPTVKAHRGPIVYRQTTPWDNRRYQVRRQGWKVRRWFKSWWWPARIRALEAQVASRFDEDWD